MTPDTMGGCPPAIPAGEPTIISQPVNSPATTDRLLFRDIVPSPLCRVRPAIIGMDGDRGPCRPDPQGLPWVAMRNGKTEPSISRYGYNSPSVLRFNKPSDEGKVNHG